MDGASRITGVYEDLPVDETIRAAIRIHPRIDKIYTINERTESGRETERTMAESLARPIPGRPVIELGDLGIEAITKGTVINEKEIFMTVSSGLALYPEHGRRFTELFKYADTAVAENSGQIGKIGTFVLRAAANFVKRTEDMGYTGFTVSVNVSVRQLSADRYYEELLTILAEAGVGPNRIAIEITESIFMESFERSVELLGKMKAAGFRISLDDFGKGYSSLAYLRKLPITSVKMDKDFIDDMLSDDRSRDLTCAIIDIWHTLSLKVVAEGVETERQTQFLNENNCDYIQGYYFSKPETTEKVLAMLETQFYNSRKVKNEDENMP